MLRFFLILLVITYLLIIVYKYFIGPFLQGFYGKTTQKEQSKSKNKIKIIYNPNENRRSNNTAGEYIDFEEVKD